MIPLSFLKRGWEWGKRREGIESEDREGERGRGGKGFPWT